MTRLELDAIRFISIMAITSTVPNVETEGAYVRTERFFEKWEFGC